MSVRLTWYLLVFAALILTGCRQAVETPGLPGNATVPPAGGQTAETATQAPAGGDLELSETYRDPVGGWAIDYPAGWFVQDLSEENREQSTVYSIGFQSWRPDAAGTEGIPAGGTKIEVTVFRGGPATLEEAVAVQKQSMITGDTQSTLVSEEQITLESGLPAVRWLLNSQVGKVPLVLTVMDGNTVLVSALGNTAPFDTFLQTFRPASAAP